MDYRDEVVFESRPEPEPPFPPEEFRARRDRVRERMAQAGIDLLWLMAPESMYYLSGYQTEWYQAQSPKQWPASSGLAVHVDHDRVILFDSEREAVLTRIFTVSTDTRFFPRQSMRDGAEFTVAELKAEGWLEGTVGLEMRSYRPNRVIGERFQRLFEAAGARTAVDATDLLREIRWVKSAAEIACLEEAARIADTGLAAAQAALRPGATELEVYGEVVRAMAAAGGENPGITMPILSGSKTNAPHALSTRRRIGAGEIVTVDVCGVYKRYHVNLARTYAMGEPPPDARAVADKAAGSIDLIKGLLRPNLPVRELNAAVVDYYKRQGLWEMRSWIGGYEMGIAFPPDWVGNFVFDPLSEVNADRLFEPGTAVNYENQFYLPRQTGMFFMIESLLFTADEARLLSATPNRLTVIG